MPPKPVIHSQSRYLQLLDAEQRRGNWKFKYSNGNVNTILTFAVKGNCHRRAGNLAAARDCSDYALNLLGRQSEIIWG